MKTYKFKICNAGDEAGFWFEEYAIDNSEDPASYINGMIEKFNDTLRPGEKPRTCLGFDLVESNDMKEHDWEKTNLFTKSWHGKSYDTYKCKQCGITGKRWGLSPDITRDPRYKAKKYDWCNPSK